MSDLTKEQENEKIRVSMTRKRYLQLLNDSDTLRLMENSGVDNWDGLGIALHDNAEDNIGTCIEENTNIVLAMPIAS